MGAKFTYDNICPLKAFSAMISVECIRLHNPSPSPDTMFHNHSMVLLPLCSQTSALTLSLWKSFSDLLSGPLVLPFSECRGNEFIHMRMCVLPTPSIWFLDLCVCPVPPCLDNCCILRCLQIQDCKFSSSVLFKHHLGSLNFLSLCIFILESPPRFLQRICQYFIGLQ